MLGHQCGVGGLVAGHRQLRAQLLDARIGRRELRLAGVVERGADQLALEHLAVAVVLGGRQCTVGLRGDQPHPAVTALVDVLLDSTLSDLVVTLLAFRTPYYRRLSQRYLTDRPVEVRFGFEQPKSSFGVGASVAA